MSAATARVLDRAGDGRAMAWVLAIMLFLTVLAAAGGIGTARAAVALRDALAGRVTIQVVAGDAATRAATAARVLAAVRGSRAVTRATAVPAAELERLLGPWAGDADLPVPALIDVDLAPAGDALRRVRALLARVAPDARLDRHADAMAPVGALLASLATLAGALVGLMAAATAAVVLLAVRAGLAAHRATIEVMHGLGATDVQVARLFQRRIARDAGTGAAAGGIAAWLVIALLGRQAAGAGSELLGGVTLGQGGWIAILLLPFAFVLFAALVARAAVTRSLGRNL